MTVFVDASALVAILADEVERTVFEEQLDRSPVNLWSAMTEWETVSALVSSYGEPIAVARAQVSSASLALELVMVPIDARVSTTALSAYQHYGKRSGHAAKLNMGDCFAYACAKANDAVLLYKGDDFARTDLA